MAKVDMNSLTQHLQGRVGDMVFRRVRGQMQAVLRPCTLRRPPPTSDQLAQQAVFKEALNYAKGALADPEKRVVYEAAAQAKNKDARALAVGDFFRPPTVQKVDMSNYNGRVGDKIAIMADDDVAVRKVEVKVRKSDGTVLEEGPAAPLFDGWVYTATTAVAAGTNLIIEVTAIDWPGNKGVKNQQYP